MASGKSPYSVAGALILRSLEPQNTWSFGVAWIILNYLRHFHTLDKIPCK